MLIVAKYSSFILLLERCLEWVWYLVVCLVERRGDSRERHLWKLLEEGLVVDDQVVSNSFELRLYMVFWLILFLLLHLMLSKLLLIMQQLLVPLHMSWRLVSSLLIIAFLSCWIASLQLSNCCCWRFHWSSKFFFILVELCVIDCSSSSSGWFSFAWCQRMKL